MQVHFQLPERRILEACALTVGTFDGVHRGHQTLVARLKAQARGLPAAALTFDDMPLCHFQPENCPRLLTLRDEKVAAFAQTPLDHLFIVPFTARIAETPAREFMQFWVEKIGLKLFIGGPDFALGKGREGTIPQLQEMGKTLGFEAAALEGKLIEGDFPISSTRSREAVEKGQVEAARDFLGHNYSMSGRVVKGQQLGRTIGVPTINFEPHARKCVPANGVYAIRARFDGELESRNAALNIGTRPTVNGVRRQIEFHVLEANIDVPPQRVEVEFVARLRDEKRFDGIESLVEQMKRDFQQAQHLLN
jgi:riboflavin kinase / FMN adenylyltransferase